jgi:hypothetical protein
MTGDSILKALAGVRSRLRRMRGVRGAAWGLVAAAVAGSLVGVARLAGWVSPPPLAAVLLLAGPLVGAIFALVRRPKWETAASAVDTHYKLKDRAATALAFLRRPAAGEWESLAVEDAARHLSGVKAAQVVPFRWPRMLSYGLAAAAAVAVLLVWPTAGPVQAAPVGPNEGLIAIAEDLEKDLEELEKKAEEQQDEELKELVKELRERTDALREEEVDLKEALATLSEMQAALQQHAQYNEALVDAQLSNLAGAMAAAEALQPTAEKLEAGEHKEAAEELAKLEKVEPGRRSEKAAAERMKKLSEEMKGKGLGALGGSVSEMADGLSGGNSDKFCQSCRSLAAQLKKHDARKKMTGLLCRQLDKLNECKGQCSMCFGQKPGECNGNGQCQNNSLAEGLKPKKSNRPSTNWGKTTSGNLFGEKTELASNGKQEQATGQAGEGPSDIETTTSPEGRERAGRAYKERYEKYRKLSEEVLDGEPIPLGHRQTIRTYFELIRPTAEVKAAAE